MESAKKACRLASLFCIAVIQWILFSLFRSRSVVISAKMYYKEKTRKGGYGKRDG